MTLKKNFKKYISDSKKRKEILYTSSKRVFVSMVFLFFLAYFSIAANFYTQISIPLFLPIYIGAVLSFIIFLSIGILKFGDEKLPKVVLYVLCLICIALGLSFLIPIF